MKIRLSLITLFTIIVSISSAQVDFELATYLPNQGNPKSMVVGDFDGNGKQDLVVQSELKSTMVVLYSQGSNNFIRKELSLVSGRINWTYVSAADMNNDGKDDLVILDQQPAAPDSKLLVCLSTGTDFNKKVIELTPVIPMWQHHIYDFDGDGKKDVLLMTSGPPVQFYKGDGAGNFTVTPITDLTPVFGSDLKFHVTDINNDQKPDFVMLSNQFMVTYIKNPGTGYTMKSALTFGAPMNSVLADFSGDGVVDIVTILYGVVSGFGEFRLSYYTNDGQGVFGEPVVLATDDSGIFGLDHADYDNDGKQDFVVGYWNSGKAVELYHNLGGGNFEDRSPDYTPAGGLRETRFVDLNGDGTREIVALSVNRMLDLYSYDNTGYVRSDGFLLGAAGSKGMIYDLDNDGFKDLVGVSGPNGAIAIWYGKGDLEFEEPIFFSGIPQALAVEVADFNKDGWGDVVSAAGYGVGGGASYTSIALSTGSRSFAPPKQLSNIGSLVLVAADFNNDDNVDLCSGYHYFLNDGQGNFTTGDLGSTLASTSGAAIHFNNDALMDLALCSDGELYVSINNGSGKFPVFQQVNLTGSIYNIRAVNLNGDSLEDLVGTTGTFVQPPAIFLLTGSGSSTFTESQVLAPASSFLTTTDVGDINLDGIQDIVSGYGKSPAYGIAVYLGKAAGGYEDAKIFESASADGQQIFAGNTVIIGDVNKDLKPDAVMFSLNGPPVAIIPNSTIKEPTVAPTSLSIVPTDLAAEVSLQKGNGNGRLITIRKDTGTDAIPADGTFYVANMAYGAAAIDTDNYAVMRSNEDRVIITGLLANTKYVLKAFEYSANSKNTIINYLATPVSASFTTLITAVNDEWTRSFSLYPNPATSVARISYPSDFKMTGEPILFNSIGSTFRLKAVTTNNEIELSTEGLQPGLYFIRLQGPRPVTLKVMKK